MSRRDEMALRQGAQALKIADREISRDTHPFIIAELSGNHKGNLSEALRLVDAAANAGADAIKLQTYTADTITIDADGPAFRVSDGHELWGGRTLHDLYSEAFTPWEWHAELFAHIRERGLIPFSSAFDESAVELLESLDAPAYKVASLEVGDTQLLRRIAATRKPVIISNGASTLAELIEAVDTLRSHQSGEVTVLACVSSYPADPREANVRSIPSLRDALGVNVGFSDHTPGLGASLAAIACGATIIEKHITLSRADGGVDSEFSLEPDEFSNLVTESRRAWEALGSATPSMTPGEAESRRLRRSLWVVDDVKAGDLVTRANVRSIRPAGGLEPRDLDRVLGRSFRIDVPKATPVDWSQF